MKKLFLLSIVLSAAIVSFSQAKKIRQSDTTRLPRADTTIVDAFQESVLDNLPVVSVDENDFNDGSNQNISAALSASRDPFFSAASFNFSVLRFRIRGYEADHFSTYLNGIMIENLDNGYTPWGFLGGLNDVLRNREVVIGLNANSFAFGDIGTTINIDARASRQRKQNTFSYGSSNRNYNNRLVLSYNTGLLNNGWAISFSASRRWADEAYMPGTFYNSYSLFTSVDKITKNQRHIFSLTVFGVPTQSGRQGASLQESINLSGNQYYNPFWGYDGRKVRNANIASSFQPYAIVSHELKINQVTTLNTAVSYSNGERYTTGLDWYKAPDPRPDYYRYLPSFQTVPSLQQTVFTAIQNSQQLQQINWNKLYEINSSNIETINSVNGIAGNNISGLRSKYIVEDRVIKGSRLAFNMVLNTKIGEHVDLTLGINYQAQNNHYFKRVNDLLGGDFYVDWNQFAALFSPSTQALQNDLNRPNRLLEVGDQFGYDYNISLRKAGIWGQATYKMKKVDLFGTIEITNTQFSRVGNVTNGLFPSTSFGKSSLYNFLNIGAKIGATYKINGRNYLYANLAFITRPPYFDNVFISPRTRHDVQEEIQSEKIRTAEIGYLHNSPYLKFRSTIYVSLMQRQMNVLSFYHEAYRNFVNYAISNINKLYTGVELGIDVKLNSTLSLAAAAAMSNNRFIGTQNAAITLDNDGSALEKQQVHVQNFKVAGSPQQAYNIGLNYRSPKFWFIGVNANYFREMWLDFNPLRRTDQAVAGVEYKSKLWNEIVNQTQLPNQFTMDAFIGYSFKLKKSFNKRSNYISWSLGMNNLLDNRNIRIGGYEQLRYDIANKNINEFPPKFYFGYGINYFTSISIRF